MTKVNDHHGVPIFLRGIIAILFSMLIFFYTGLSVEILLVIFGILVIFDGVFSIATYSYIKDKKHGWLFLVGGIFDLILAIVIFVWPTDALMFLVYFAAIWAIVLGFIELWTSFIIAEELPGKITLGIIGMLSLVIGIFMMAFPIATIELFVWILGIYALVIGIAQIVYSLEVKK